MKTKTTLLIATLRPFSRVTPLCFVGAILLFATPAHAAQALSGHVPPAVKSLNLQPIGRPPATQRLHLAIGLPLRNQDALNALLRELYDPASPQYHQYLTPEEFTEKFGPTKDDYVAVANFAKANRLTVTTIFPNRVLVDVEGTVADVEKALHVTMRAYNHPTEARTFYAPDSEPSLDLAVPISHIGGLENYWMPHPNFRLPQPGTGPGATPNVGLGPSGTYMGYDFRAAYVPGTTLTGSGQIVGLLQFDGYTNSDIAYYETLAGLPSVTLTNILIDGATNGPSGNGNELEVALDIEMVISMAPGVSKVVLYMALNPSPWEDLLHRMANDNYAKQISSSWTGGAPDDAAAEAALVQMAAQGQSFFNASGDNAAYTTSIPFPPDSSNVVAVGGTTLTTAGPTNIWVSETVWNPGGCYGSGGGISTDTPIPPWQQGVSMAFNQGSTTKRNIPDVALIADNVYVRSDGFDYDGVGGTSCASPLWAGFTALVDQQGAINGKLPVGFLNPAIYAIGTGTSYTACFHDITTGNNESPFCSPSQFSAVTGYDLCTGWGTPTGTNLINALVGSPSDAAAIAAAGWTLTAEGCTPTNGVIDPNETVTVNFALQNNGTKNASNIVATLLATGGVTSPSGAQSYGTLVAGGGAVSEPFTFTANGTCGGNITATLQIQTNSANYGTVTYSFTLGAISTPFSENFDGVTAPALPAGWTTSAGGAEVPWVTSTAVTATPPNAAFSPDSTAIGSNTLVSPVIPIVTSTAQLVFGNNYNLESGDDGGVLDIKIGGGAFQDILTAGGSFAQNGYTARISTAFGNPIGGRMAWSGDSYGFLYTVVNLPAAAAGQNIQLRWMCGTDSSVGYSGWYIDTISIYDGVAFACCTGGVSPSSFRITSIVKSNNDILINWTSGIGQTNALQATAGTANGSYSTNNFANIFSVTNTVTTSTNYTDVGGATNVPARYYRVRLVP
jgi:hypothetical protein